MTKLRRTRSSAFRVNATYTSPNKNLLYPPGKNASGTRAALKSDENTNGSDHGLGGRPVKRVKLDRSREKEILNTKHNGAAGKGKGKATALKNLRSNEASAEESQTSSEGESEVEDEDLSAGGRMGSTDGEADEEEESGSEPPRSHTPLNNLRTLRGRGAQLARARTSPHPLNRPQGQSIRPKTRGFRNRRLRSAQLRNRGSSVGVGSGYPAVSPRKRKRGEVELSDSDVEMDMGSQNEEEESVNGNDEYTDVDEDESRSAIGIEDETAEDGDEVGAYSGDEGVPGEEDEQGDSSVRYIGSSTKRSRKPRKSVDGFELIDDMDDETDEPEFINEDDQYLLGKAPEWILHRLKKADLKRLWQVAGLWPGGEDIDDAVDIEQEERLTKDTLVEGIVNTRVSTSSPSTADRRIAGLPRTGRYVSGATSASNTPLNDSPTTDSADLEDDGDVAPNTSANHARGVSGGKHGAVATHARAHGKGRHTLAGSFTGVHNGRRPHFEDVPRPLPTGVRRRRYSQGSSATASSAGTGSPHGKRANAAAERGSGGRKGKLPLRCDEGSESASNATADDEGADEGMTANRRRTRKSGKLAGTRRGSVAADDEANMDAQSGVTPRNLRNTRINGSAKTPARRAARKATQAVREQLDSSDEGEPEAGTTSLEDSELDQPESDDPTPRQGGRALQSLEPHETGSPVQKRLRRRSSPALIASPVTDDSSDRDSMMAGSSASSPDSRVQRKTKNKRPLRISKPGPNGRVRRTNSLAGLERDLDLVNIVDEEEIDTAPEADADGDVQMAAVDDEDADGSSDMEDDDVEMADQTSTAEESGDVEDEEADAEVDMSDAMLATITQAHLLRYRKDELVHMCEARELDTEGTKQQLAQWLIEWRDATARQESASPSSASSSSSAATARPMSQEGSQPDSSQHRQVNGKGKGKHIHVPHLLRGHENVADPHTPPHSHGDTKDDVEPDGTLDLEELGLVDKEIPFHLLEKGDKIGSGGFKDVFIGKFRPTGKRTMKVAICEPRDELSEMDIRELKLLAEFSHENIVKLLGIAIPERSLRIPCMVVTELCEKGDLFDYVRNVAKPSRGKVLAMMLDISKGLKYLHERKPAVIHRDVKSSNILITKSGKCKVGDFGLARVKSKPQSIIRSLVGTVNWQAPELWSPKPRYNYKVDVFSCAMVFWEMLSGWTADEIRYPWEGHNEHSIYQVVGQEKQRPPTDNFTEIWGEDLVKLLQRMWEQDPQERPMMYEVCDDLEAIISES